MIEHHDPFELDEEQELDAWCEHSGYMTDEAFLAGMAVIKQRWDRERAELYTAVLDWSDCARCGKPAWRSTVCPDCDDRITGR